MILTLIAAIADNRVIGRNGGLPWSLPKDLRRFKRVTTGHQVIMGRRTYETLLGPLPDRRNIVVTRQQSYPDQGISVAGSVDEAISLAGQSAGDDEVVYVLGGGEVYRDALPRADRLDLTRVESDVEGDTTFPSVDWEQWRVLEQEHHPADDRHSHAFRFELWQRR